MGIKLVQSLSVGTGELLMTPLHVFKCSANCTEAISKKKKKKEQH